MVNPCNNWILTGCSTSFTCFIFFGFSQRFGLRTARFRHRPRLSRYGQWLQLGAKWWVFLVYVDLVNIEKNDGKTTIF